MRNKKNLLIYIWIVNGIILLVIFLIGLGVFINETIIRRYFSSSSQSGVIVGVEKQNIKQENQILQTVDFFEFKKIYDSRYRLLEINELDYEFVKIGDELLTVEEIPTTMQMEIPPSSSKYYSKLNSPNASAINVLFYSPENNDSRLLLDRIAYIRYIDYPQFERDSLQNLILYQISFEDTNNDNRLNNQDKSNFYLSELDGTGLKQIIPDSLTVYNYDFDLSRNQIYFTVKSLKKDVREEHIDKEIYIYNLSKQQLSRATKINHFLKNSRKILINEH